MGQVLYKSFAFVPPVRWMNLGKPSINFIKTLSGNRISYEIILPETKSNDFVILFSHGNAEDLESSTPLLQEISNTLGAVIVTYDYPGYGFSTGSPSEKGCCDAVHEVFEYITDKMNIPSKSIVLLGSSIGSGPTVDLACTLHSLETPLAGMILVSPIESVVNTVLPIAKYFITDMFENYKKIPYISARTLILHGKSDTIVNCSAGKTLARLSRNLESLHLIPNTGHNDIFYRKETYDILKEFIDGLPGDKSSLLKSIPHKPPGGLFEWRWGIWFVMIVCIMCIFYLHFF